MERIRNLMHSGAGTVIMFLIAVGLLLGGGIGAARAVKFYQAEGEYDVKIDLYHIKVKILENGTEPEGGVLLQNLLDQNSSEGTGKAGADDTNTAEAKKVLELDKVYTEEITVLNPNGEGADTDEIDEYVKVTVTKYWEKNSTDDQDSESGAIDPT